MKGTGTEKYTEQLRREQILPLSIGGILQAKTSKSVQEEEASHRKKESFQAVEAS